MERLIMNLRYTKAHRIFQQFKSGLEMEKEVLEKIIATAMRRVGHNHRDAHSLNN